MSVQKSGLNSSIWQLSFVASIFFLALTSALLLVSRISLSDSSRYSFLFWNLFLAAVPLAIARFTVKRINKHGWNKWQQIILTFLWLAFLPNSFYLITDLIHLRPNFEADPLFDVVLLTSFLLSGLSFGFSSLYIFHNQIQKRFSPIKSFGVIALVLLASSFAICLGRYTRWNTWDILVQPAGLIFDISDRFLHPNSHLETYQTTAVLFIVLLAFYMVVYSAVGLVKSQSSR